MGIKHTHTHNTHLVLAHVQQLVELNTAESEFAEGTLLLIGLHLDLIEEKK